MLCIWQQNEWKNLPWHLFYFSMTWNSFDSNFDLVITFPFFMLNFYAQISWSSTFYSIQALKFWYAVIPCLLFSLCSISEVLKNLKLYACWKRFYYKEIVKELRSEYWTSGDWTKLFLPAINFRTKHFHFKIDFLWHNF